MKRMITVIPALIPFLSVARLEFQHDYDDTESIDTMILHRRVDPPKLDQLF